jgi:hypothetical protein
MYSHVRPEQTAEEVLMSGATISGLQVAFFKAMTAGWVSGNTGETSLAELPGMKTIPFEHGDYRVLDMYTVSPESGRSSGSTTIWHKNVPIWVMYYGGYYSEIAMPFLKECLHRAYVEERRFYGGRGPHFVRGDRFTYINNVASDAWADFRGEESIFDLNEQPLGSHWYRGMSLF